MLLFIWTIKTIWVLMDFQWSSLPFGLSSACFCLKKLLRPLVRCWHAIGHVSFVYLDDTLGGLPDNCLAQAASIIQRRDLDSSGFVVNKISRAGR